MIMADTKKDLGRVSPELGLYELYERIYSWNRKHKKDIPSDSSSSLTKRYLAIVRDLPKPEEASEADVFFVANEIIRGFMNWTHDREDEFGIKMGTYARVIAERFGNKLQNLHLLAQKSRLAWKHKPMMRVIKRTLQSLSLEELRELYYYCGITQRLSDTASRTFVMNRIIEKASPERLFQNQDFLSKVVNQTDQLFTSFEDVLGTLEEDSIKRICEELGKGEITKAGKKADVIGILITEVPFSEIWKSKSLQKRLKPKKLTTTSLRRIKKQISTMEKLIKEMTERQIETNVASFREIAGNNQQILEELRRIRSLFPTDRATDLKAYLQAFYEQALKTEGPISAENLHVASKELLNKLNVDEWGFTLRGMELLLLHYLLTQVKTFQWKPSFEEFMSAVRQEFEKIKGVGEQAEIPTLRELVCTRMGISEEIFDSMLTEAWEKEIVRLDVGAPIGRFDVKYLKTKGGNLFFYVKLKK